MLSVTITEKDGPSTTTTFDKTEVLIGRVKGNDVVLPKTNVSKRHSRIVVKDGKIILIDLKSTNGTFVNGRKITGPHVMQDGDKVFIGDFTLDVKEVGGAPMGMAPSAPQGPMGMGPSAPQGPMGMGPGANQGPMSMGAPNSVPSFGPIPSAASLPSINPVSNMPGHMNNNMPGHPGGMNMRNQHFPAQGIGNQLNGPNLGSAPHQNIPEPVAPPGIPNVAPVAAGPMAMDANSAPMGGGLGIQNVSAGPSLGAPSLGAPNLSQPAPLANAAQLSNLGAQPIASSRPAGGGANPVKQSNISAPVGDGVIDKSLRLPGSNQQDRGLGASAAKAASGAVRGKKEFSAASLPDDIIVDDKRTADSEALLKAARVVMDQYLNENDFQAISAQPYPPEADIQDSCYKALSKSMMAVRASLGKVNQDALLDMLLKEACSLGAIDSLIDDAEVSAFTVYNFETIIVERKGRRELSSLQFTSADTLYLAAQRLLAYQGINPQTAPAVSEVRFGDGTQFEVILPPVSVASTTIVVRKASHEFNALSALAQKGMLSAEMDKFLKLCVKARRNILIVGAQGAGRTSVLNALGAEIPDGERIVTVESSAMLVMPQVYVMSLEAQGAGFQGGDIASLVRQAGRLRAERVLVDSIQTADDASAFVSAICAGTQGAMATMSALNATEGFNLLKRMVASDSTASALVGNIDIIVTVRAFTDARRRIVEIAEVVEGENGLMVVPVFGWIPGGMGSMAMGDGQFKALGNVPRFCTELERGGVAVDNSIFNA